MRCNLKTWQSQVLWDVFCILQEQLAAPFRCDYLDLLKKARDNVQDVED
jgi:hypothetical protein